VRGWCICGGRQVTTGEEGGGKGQPPCRSQASSRRPTGPPESQLDSRPGASSSSDSEHNHAAGGDPTAAAVVCILCPCAPSAIIPQAMYRYLVAAFLTHTPLVAGQDTGRSSSGPYYTCASQTDFIANANPFIKGICCTQSSETCSAGLYPSTCSTPPCARAVQMVSNGCMDWLAEPPQAMLSIFKTSLQALGDKCQTTTPAKNTILLSGSSTTLKGIAACGATIIDGRAEDATKWHDDLAITTPPGTTATVTVRTLWLPVDDVLEIRNGVDSKAPPLQRLQGKTVPAASTFVASGQNIFLRLLSNGKGAGQPVGLSLKVGCSCSATTACNNNGVCRDGACVCTAGWVGPTCGTPDPCISSPCKHGGTCTAAAASTRRTLSEHPSATTCEAGQLQTAITEINTQCCGADDAACVDGLPRSCDAGCAKVFLPFWDSCGWQLGSAEEYASVIALCEARVADEESGAAMDHACCMIQ
jgi:hypothetical protein